MHVEKWERVGEGRKGDEMIRGQVSPYTQIWYIGVLSTHHSFSPSLVLSSRTLLLSTPTLLSYSTSPTLLLSYSPLLLSSPTLLLSTPTLLISTLYTLCTILYTHAPPPTTYHLSSCATSMSAW